MSCGCRTSSAGLSGSMLEMMAPSVLLTSRKLSKSCRAWKRTPIVLRSTLPWSRICPTTSLATLIGTAKPRSLPPPRVLMPTTSPRRLTNGPPELPGLIAASVCSQVLNSPVSSPPPRSMACDRMRSWQEMMPKLIDRERPYGLPMATTVSPSSTVSELPNGAHSNSNFFSRTSSMSIWMTARSVQGSAPTSLALTRSLLKSVQLSSSARPATW